jgi:hypothetical protein
MISRRAILLSLLSLTLLSCDFLGGEGGSDEFNDFPEGPDSFSLEVHVQDEEGNPVEGAEVGVHPCYSSGCDSITPKGKREASTDSLISFEAEIENGGEVVLSWQTSGFGSSTSGFYIDRKVDGPFEEIGFLSGGGGAVQTYRFQDTDTEPGNEYTYRLVRADTDGTETPLDTTAVEVLDPESTEIDPIYPNPISSTPGILELRIADPADVKSTAYLLNGEEVSTITNGQASNVGRYTYEWPRSREKVAGGLYLIHSRARVDGNTVASSTDYIIYARGTSNAAIIGSTSEDGIVSTESPARFPGLYDLPEIELRDENGNSQEAVTDVPETVQFVVSILRDEYVFERRVTEGENTLTLTVSR